ncbi:hypothetical protein ACNQR7_31935 [Mycolicibacterium senegalense]|uniref:hypothetical protein n=1 Tax=Mycolicibacterium senegalense TaxID=1796 RepID=UPI003AAB87CF
MPLRELEALDAGVEASGDNRVDERALQGTQDQLRGDLACASFDDLRHGGADDAGDNRLCGSHSCGTLDWCTPVPPGRGDQKCQSRSKNREIRDKHLFRELNFGASFVDRVAEPFELVDEDIDRTVSGDERLKLALHRGVGLAFREACQRVSCRGLNDRLLRLEKVGELFPASSLFPGFVLIPFGEGLTDEIADPFQPAWEPYAHRARPSSMAIAIEHAALRPRGAGQASTINLAAGAIKPYPCGQRRRRPV